MFDSVTFSLSKEHFNKADIIELFERKFNFKSETKYNHGSSKHCNYLNWKFWITENNLNFSGSLTNLILGNNIKNANYSDIHNALKKLEAILEIPLIQSKIRRIDISRTLDVDFEVSKYLEIFLPPKNYQSIIYGNYDTLYLVNEGVVSTKFYDKNKEDKKKYRGKTLIVTSNKIRYELHVPKNVNKFFKIPELTFGDLFNKEIYNDLITTWYQSYLKIPTNKKYKPTRLNFASKTKFRDSLAMESVSARGGIDAIDRDLRKPNIDKKTRLEIRKYLRSTFMLEPEPSYLKQELDTKIKEVYDQTIK